MHRDVLRQDLPWMAEVVRAKQPARWPVVLTQRKVLQRNLDRHHSSSPPSHCAAANLPSVPITGVYVLAWTRPRPSLTASAHKLARLVYTMITKGEQYVDQGQAYFEQQHRDRAIRNLMHRAQQLGMTLVDMPAETATTA